MKVGGTGPLQLPILGAVGHGVSGVGGPARSLPAVAPRDTQRLTLYACSGMLPAVAQLLGDRPSWFPGALGWLYPLTDVPGAWGNDCCATSSSWLGESCCGPWMEAWGAWGQKGAVSGVQHRSPQPHRGETHMCGGLEEHTQVWSPCRGRAGSVCPEPCPQPAH